MHLPQSFRPFPHPTLIAVTDHIHAKLFLAEQRTVNSLETLEVRPDTLDRDRVAIQTSGGQMVSGEQDGEPTEWSREKLYALLSKNLMQRLSRHEFEDLVLTVPGEHENDLKESLHIDLLKRVRVCIPKLLTHEDLLDVVAHVEEAE